MYSIALKLIETKLLSKSSESVSSVVATGICNDYSALCWRPKERLLGSVTVRLLFT